MPETVVPLKPRPELSHIDINIAFAHNLRVRSALNRSRFASLDELRFFKASDLLELRNIGKKGVDDICNTMHQLGASLLGDDEDRATALIDAYGDARDVPVWLGLHYRHTELPSSFFACIGIATLGDLADLTAADLFLRLREQKRGLQDLRIIHGELRQFGLYFKESAVA